MVDLHGDLAGILQISERHSRKIELKPRETLDSRAHSELQQVEKVVGGSLPPESLTPSEGQGALVAGVGFEPTTFRL